MSARAKKRLCGGRPRTEDHRHITFFRLSRRHPPLPRCLSFHSLMQLSGSYKKRCPRAFPMSGPTAVNRPRHGKGTRAYSRLTEVNPYSAPVIRGHMCLVCCTRPIAAIALFTPGFRAFRNVGTGEKKVVGWQTSFRALPPHNLFPPIAPPSSTTQMPFVSFAHAAIVLGQKAVSESLPHVGSHGGKPPPAWERHSGLLSPNGG